MWGSARSRPLQGSASLSACALRVHVCSCWRRVLGPGGGQYLIETDDHASRSVSAVIRHLPIPLRSHLPQLKGRRMPARSSAREELMTTALPTSGLMLDVACTRSPASIGLPAPTSWAMSLPGPGATSLGDLLRRGRVRRAISANNAAGVARGRCRCRCGREGTGPSPFRKVDPAGP